MRNRFKEDSTLKKVRLFLGISQERMADYFKIRTSLYSMTEGRYRILDPYNQEKLAELYNIKESAGTILPETKEALAEQQAKAITWAKNQLLGCKVRIYKWEAQLLILQKEQTRCLAVLNRMTTLRTFLNNDSDTHFCNKIFEETTDKQKESSLPVVLALELKLTAARAEQAFLENTLNNLESNVLHEPRI